MSAVLAQTQYTANLVLAAGVTAFIQAPTLDDLAKTVAKLQPAANEPKISDTPVAKAAPKPAAQPQAQEPAAGNASAGTDTPASAQGAASGSAQPSGDAPRLNYDDVKDRVLKLAKISRDTASGALAKFGVDHGNKLKLEQYGDFIAHADTLLAGGARA